MANEKTKIVSFKITGMEGLIWISDMNKGREFDNDYDFNNALAFAQEHSPEGGACDKVGFELAFADGETYGGRFELRKDDGAPDILAHVRREVDFRAGDCPGHMTQERYDNFIAMTKCDTAMWQGFRNTYQLGAQ